jgi:hypothetical protein
MPISRLPDSWAIENATGRRQAECLLTVLRQHRAPHLLGRAVSRMVESGRYDGRAVGFCHTIGVACLNG